MDWTFRNDLPIYSQLVDRIKLAIVFNPNTMQRALQELERQGLVFSQRTAGRFVTEDITVIDEIKKTLAKGQIESFLKAMKELGYDRQGIIDLLKEDE